MQEQPHLPAAATSVVRGRAMPLAAAAAATAKGEASEASLATAAATTATTAKAVSETSIDSPTGAPDAAAGAMGSCGPERVVLSTYALGYNASGAAAAVPGPAPATILCAAGFDGQGVFRTTGR